MKLKNDMNLWWAMWWAAVILMLGSITCVLTGCSAAENVLCAPQESAATTECSVEDISFTEPAVKPVRVRPAPPAEPKPEPEPAPEPRLLGWFTVTAYCPCVECCGVWSAEHPSRGEDYVQKTASGTIPAEGRTIAVDPDVIPYGTTAYFEGPDGLLTGYVAEDCGGAINGNDIDLYFESHEAANRWGIRELDVFVMPEVSE